MPDYSQGKVYEIFNSITDDTYIGSTTQLLCNRMKNHRNHCRYQNRTTYNCKLYQCLRQHGVDNFYIELIEKCPCTIKEELHAREAHWIRQERPSLNGAIPGRTDKQYYQDNKEKINEYNTNYHKNHWDAYFETAKRYRDKMQNTPGYKEKVKERNQKYRQDNKDAIRIYNKEKYEKLEKVKCECGCVVSKYYLSKHKSTPKHEELMQMNKNS